MHTRASHEPAGSQGLETQEQCLLGAASCLSSRKQFLGAGMWLQFSVFCLSGSLAGRLIGYHGEEYGTEGLPADLHSQLLGSGLHQGSSVCSPFVLLRNWPLTSTAPLPCRRPQDSSTALAGVWSSPTRDQERKPGKARVLNVPTTPLSSCLLFVLCAGLSH